MLEQLVAWAGDCQVRGLVDLGDGRLSDLVNESETITFQSATLRALDDGHEVEVEQVEVGRQELHLIEVVGRRGDPVRRRRTIEERVTVELGPFEVTGNLHRLPSTQPLASLASWARFVPMTDVLVVVPGAEAGIHEDVVLINRQRITRAEPRVVLPVDGTNQVTGPAPA